MILVENSSAEGFIANSALVFNMKRLHWWIIALLLTTIGLREWKHAQFGIALISTSRFYSLQENGNDEQGYWPSKVLNKLENQYGPIVSYEIIDAAGFAINGIVAVKVRERRSKGEVLVDVQWSSGRLYRYSDNLLAWD